ncbi:phage tail protein [Pantoea ananatis]|nr:phage tail protein [Pantoea ananatis]
MTTKYFALLTNQGAAKLANAAAHGTQLKITEMALGDGGGSLPTPDPAQTKLISEKRRAALNTLKTDAANINHIIAEQIIPEDEGGFWIREIGLYDADGTMVAVGNCAETYKPQLQEGSGRTQTVRMILIVNSPSSVTLKIDPSVVLATRQYVDDKTIEVKGYADDVMKKHLEAANPHDQYLLKEQNLADLPDKTLARQNLKLGTAALSDVQTSKDDVTAGHVLVNGGAIAVRSIAASAVDGFTYKDANDLPANAVSFVYASAKNSPGFDGSLLSYAGLNENYHVQISAKYQTGNRIAFRGLNGDNKEWNGWYEFYHTGNKPTARDINAVQAGGGAAMAAEGMNKVILGWDGQKLLGQVDNFSLGAMFYEKNPPTPAQVGAVPAAGGSVAYLDGAEHYATQNASWPASGAYADQYKNPRAPFVKPFGYAAPRGNSCYSPIVKGLIQTDGLGYGTSVSFGALTLGDGHFANGCIHVIGDDGTSQAWSFDPHTGNLRSPGQVYAGAAFLNTDGNVYGAAWGGWLSDQLNAVRNTANDAWNKANDGQANRVTDIRLTAEHQVGATGIRDYRNANTVLTGFTNGDADYSAEGLFWSYIQYYRSGQWITVGRS